MSTITTQQYEPVIGLEIHIQLLTESKAFCGDSAAYGGAPNTQVSPISLGHPGTLPKHNKTAIEMAIKMGLALQCDITRYNMYARKNYFYADLPKGYQITQDKTPLCTNGFVKIKTKDGNEKNIRLIRIHMEEDSGKSMHDQDITDTLVDYNRAGVPLIEVVSAPDIRNAEEAFQFVTEIRKLVRYLDICDGNMEEGSLRCDANISVRPAGTTGFGVKVEVKNMNSITNVKRAIEFEIERQIACIEKGETIYSETRSFNALKGTTFSMRSKESVNDYRYFPEPDLPPVVVDNNWLERIRQTLPELPEALFIRLVSEFGLPAYDAQVLTEDKDMATYYLNLVAHTSNYKAASNWLMGTVKSYLNESAGNIKEFKISPEKIAALIALVDQGKLSNSSASQTVFPELVKNPTATPLALAEQLNVIQTSDDSLISSLVDTVLAKYPEKVAEYKAGKVGLMGLFVGETMKLSQGKADPKKATEILKNRLEK